MKSLFTFTTLAIFLFITIAQAQYGGGTGEPNNPYLIYTAEHLNEMSDKPNDWDKHFRLMADIDLSCFSYDKALIASGTMLIPSLEFYGVAFTGVFDGNRYKISHLTIKGEEYLGFFGRLGSGAEVRDLGVVDVNIVSSGSHIGGLVGSNNGATVTMCYSTGSVSGAGDRSFYQGGLLGSIDNSSGLRGLVTNCYSAVNVTGGNIVGGLMGGSYGPVDPYFDPMPFSPDPVPVINCYSIGAVNGENSVGGLVGNNNWSGSTLIHCYSTGAVNGNLHIGGLVGYGSGDVSACFWNIETSGQKTSKGGTGKTTSEMQAAVTFLEAGWDFKDETNNGLEDIWWILEGQSYPRLRWQYGQAFSPYPPDDAADIPLPLTLSWLPGGSGLYHDVYFGEDEEAVTEATTGSPDIYRGRQEPEITTFYLDTLKLEKTYYWRIDEVNQADPNSLLKGNVWSFTTADFIVVDDFESYDDVNPIWWAWKDGLGSVEPYYQGNGTGSAVCEININNWFETIVHSGFQSMGFYYDNNKEGFAKYSEAIKTLSYPHDWTYEDVSELSLLFHGDPTNDSELMYVAVSNRTGMPAVIYHDDPNAVRIDTWIEWIIPLQSFADQGIDLTDVDRIAIGFGTRGNLTIPGGRGKMYFDDIRIYNRLVKL